MGDLFHSRANKEHLLFEKWRKDLAQLEVLLVKGNHDVLPADWYTQMNINVFTNNPLRINPFAFTHDYLEIEKYPRHADDYFITGHLHPGVFIKGTSRQSLTFPCFYFAEQFAVLPAYSKFSGLALIEKKKNNKVFAIVNNELLEI